MSEAWTLPLPTCGWVGFARSAVELLDADEDAAHLRDRVDPEMRTRAVRRSPVRLDLEVHEAAMRDGELQLGRLGHDRRIGAQARRDGLRADARELLVATAVRITSPRRPRRAASAAASMHAARLPFMSYAPRP